MEDKFKDFIKPPLGLIPSYIWYEKRVEEILNAVNRCIQADYEIQIKWIEEYNQIVLNKSTKKGN